MEINSRAFAKTFKYRADLDKKLMLWIDFIAGIKKGSLDIKIEVLV